MAIMAKLTAEIEARFSDVIRETRKLNSEIAKAEREFKRAAVAGKGYDASMSALAVSSDDAAESVGRLNTRAGKSSAIFFQAGQAISDFAVAGVLGAANNLELLAFQLGASGPVIAGITALTVSALVFRDEIEEAFAPLSSLTRDAREGIEELLKVIGGENRSLLLFESQIPAALEEQKRLVEELNSEYEELLPKLDLQRALLGDFITDRFRARLPAFLVPLTEVEKNLAKAQGALEALEKQQESLNKEQAAFAQGSLNSTLALNRQVEESVRLGIERLGLEKEIASVSQEELFSVLERGELEQFIQELQEKRKKNVREEKTLLERTEDINKRLKDQLEGLRDIDNSRLGILLLQNAELRDQIRLEQEAAQARARIAGVERPERPSIPVAEQEDIFAGPQFDDIIGFQFEPLLLSGGVLSAVATNAGTVAAQVAAAFDLEDPIEIGFVDPMKRAEEQAEQLASVISGGLTNSFSSFFEAIGGGEDPFSALRNSIGDFAIDIGRTVIGFAFAGDAIKNFVKNAPGVGIAAGVALVGLGSALKRSAEEKTNNFVAGAGVGGRSAPDRPPIIDPRQGRDGRFRRNLEQFESGFVPQSSLASSGLLDLRFAIAGEDLVAVSDKNQRRQGRTRGSSPARALVKTRSSR